MMTIIWQTNSNIFYESIVNGRLANDASGGVAYNFHAFQAIKEIVAISMDASTPRHESENIITYWYRIANHNVRADIVIMDPFLISLGKLRSTSYDIGMIHHIDETLCKQSIKHRWYLHRLRNRLRQLDCIVVVSKYWKKWLESNGCDNTKVIYNSFDINEFKFTNEARKRFKTKYHLHSDKPIIYIGNAQRKKGVMEI